jgi:cytoskeletal protein CcmA (bactofilin family)
MATGDLHPEEEIFCDQLAIEGARLGSQTLLAQTIDIYKNGRLDIYAEEIEKYYL